MKENALNAMGFGKKF